VRGVELPPALSIVLVSLVEQLLASKVQPPSASWHSTSRSCPAYSFEPSSVFCRSVIRLYRLWL